MPDKKAIVNATMENPPRIEITGRLYCFDCQGVPWEPRQVRHLCPRCLAKAAGQSVAKSVVDEALQIVGGERKENYGDAEDNFRKIAAIWNGILGDKLKGDISAADVAYCMIGLKLARQSWQHKFDNLVDIVGYTLCATNILEKQK